MIKILNLINYFVSKVTTRCHWNSQILEDHYNDILLAFKCLHDKCKSLVADTYIYLCLVGIKKQLKSLEPNILQD